MKIGMSIFLFFSVLTKISTAMAYPSNFCSTLFLGAPKIQVIAPSHSDQGDEIAKEAKIIAETAQWLGLAVPPQQLNIVPSEQLNVMATSGGHPAPHWSDGAEVLRALQSSQGVLEFVTKGCPVCRGFYSASTPKIPQRLVQMHVRGHDDMSATSVYQTMRPGDAPLASYQLATTIREAGRQSGQDAVSLYYQFVKSFSGLQDFVDGSFEGPENFSHKNQSMPTKIAEPVSFWEAVKAQGGLFTDLIPAKKGQDKTSNAWQKTNSVLQALTENLPPEATTWEKSVFKLYEQSQRMYPAIVQTKIMNEGWATLQMYILAKHLPWTDSKDLVQYAQLISGVTWASFENPYWIGLSGWMNLYKQFRERKDIRDLPESQKDQRFISWARAFYSGKNDSQFIKEAIDERWISDNKFFLYRRAQWHELDRSLPPEKQGYIALTRNWKRVQNFIIARYVNIKQKVFPSISMRNPAETPGHILFVQNHEQGIPLDFPSAAKTGFAIAQVMKKPIHLRALFLYSSQEALLVVSPKGEVEFYPNYKEKERAPEAEKQLEAKISSYKTDLLGSFDERFSDAKAKEWGRLATEVSEGNGSGASRFVQFAPHAAGAIHEYLRVIEKRLRNSIESALNGKSQIDFSKKGVKLSVLPEIPTYQYVARYADHLISKIPPGPIDNGRNNSTIGFEGDLGQGIIGAGPYLPGDKFGIPKKQGKGKGKGKGDGDEKGEGEGEGEGEGDGDGDGKDGDATTPQPGNGGGSSSPQDVHIPLKLYGQLLKQYADLPNLRRTKGQSEQPDYVRSGVIQSPAGNLEWDEIIIAAVDKARAIRRGKNLPYDNSVSFHTLVKEALPFIEPSDYFVSGEKKIPLPDFDAVVLVNVDLTGSMGGDRIRLAKNMLYNLEALLKTKYKRVVFRYVGFDSEARELSRTQIFKQFFGGGTAYGSAVELDRQILSEYSNSQWNKYMITFGDGETSAQDANRFVDGVNSFRDDLQFFGMALTNERGFQAPMTEHIINAHRRIKEEWPWVGIAELRNDEDMLPAIRKLLLND